MTVRCADARGVVTRTAGVAMTDKKPKPSRVKVTAVTDKYGQLVFTWRDPKTGETLKLPLGGTVNG